MSEEKQKVQNNLNEAKIFKARESFLTELITNNEHFRSIRNMVTAFLVLFLTATFGHYIFDANELIKDVEFIKWSFINFDKALLIWVGMNISVILFWYTLRFFDKLPKTFTLYFIIYMALFFVIPPYTLWAYVGEYCPFLFTALTGEQVRLLMKVYSFVVELYYNKHINNKDDEKNATLSHLIYFLFVPTLLYRHSYPRTKKFNFSKFASYAIQYLACLFFKFAVVRRFIQHNFEKAGIEPFNIRHLFYTFILSGLVGISLMFTLFYGFLHCWLNIWGEMLCFSDRLFYTDWWTSNNFNKYYRRWNIVVHDWLYSYIYAPVAKATNNRSLGALSTFIVSAVVHEYILILTLGFFYPILFIEFAFLGVLAFYIGIIYKGDETIGNILLSGSLFIGWASLVSLYSIEWYSRKNCPPVYPDNKLLDSIYPRSWNCVTFTI